MNLEPLVVTDDVLQSRADSDLDFQLLPRICHAGYKKGQSKAKKCQQYPARGGRKVEWADSKTSVAAGRVKSALGGCQLHQEDKKTWGGHDRTASWHKAKVTVTKVNATGMLILNEPRVKEGGTGVPQPAPRTKVQ